MYYDFDAPLGSASEIIIIAIFLVAVLRVIIVSVRKKVEFDQYQKTRDQYMNPDIKPVIGYQQREGKAVLAPMPRMDYTLSRGAPEPFEGGFTEGQKDIFRPAAPKSDEPSGRKRQVREARQPKYGKMDSDQAYLIRDRHGSRLSLDPAALRKMIIIKELLDRPISMREKRGYRAAR